jgi:hypothetical protein
MTEPGEMTGEDYLMRGVFVGFVILFLACVGAFP